MEKLVHTERSVKWEALIHIKGFAHIARFVQVCSPENNTGVFIHAESLAYTTLQEERHIGTQCSFIL